MRNGLSSVPIAGSAVLDGRHADRIAAWRQALARTAHRA
ncbi:hypothetical protein GA0070614_2615 [Micromonospora coxensis]|uniref:Uncharacterized protein n=1 Tax=Micromonospora coxensis TaxID=356852 RepID=A0A1C5ID41_9ACTN|nr:hypothetical protein GA0070614_2615 [Micromonospora coxensis]